MRPPLPTDGDPTPAVPPTRAGAGPANGSDDARLVEGLRQGDEIAFVAIVERYQTMMVRLAAMYLPRRSIAEDVVQDTWLAVLRGISTFQARASFKTWLVRILINRAITRARQERRTVPFSSLWTTDEEPSVDPARFRSANAAELPGHWLTPPESWGASADERLLAHETRSAIDAAIAALAPAQREVITLRDIVGLSADEVYRNHGIPEAQQRALLHRARSRVRRVLERELRAE